MIRTPLLAIAAVSGLPLTAYQSPLAAQTSDAPASQPGFTTISRLLSHHPGPAASRERLGSDDQARAYELLALPMPRWTAPARLPRHSTGTPPQPGPRPRCGAVSPKITSRFALALAQCCLRDSASIRRSLLQGWGVFLSGSPLPVRPAPYPSRGPGVKITVDSALARARAPPMERSLGRGASHGRVRSSCRGQAGRDSYAASCHPNRCGAVDTLAHLTSCRARPAAGDCDAAAELEAAVWR